MGREFSKRYSSYKYDSFSATWFSYRMLPETVITKEVISWNVEISNFILLMLKFNFASNVKMKDCKYPGDG